jgi:hypothetical protein
MADKWVEFSRLASFLKEEVKKRYSPPYGSYVYNVSNGGGVGGRASILGRQDKKTYKTLKQINDPTHRKMMERYRQNR